MAIESPIAAADGWFTGEDKTLRFSVSGVDGTFGAWVMEWKLYARGATAAAVTKTATVISTDICEVVVAAADTVNLADGTYQYVLRRIDAGHNAVLAYGAAVLRAVRTAG